MKKQGENFRKDPLELPITIRQLADQLPTPSHLERAILHTLHYFDVLRVPLTATQLWRTLLTTHPQAAQRWEGQHVPSLAEVQTTLRTSAWLKPQIASQWGYYALAGHQELVVEHLRRHAIAQQKWKILQRSARWLAWVPFVDMLAASGSLALYNTKPSSDLDVLVVTRRQRIWTTRLLLLLVAQLLGRRRKHWDEAAPDKLCLNHYLTTASLVIAPEIRNEYTAVLYTHTIPLSGREMHERFLAANAPWLKRYCMAPELSALASHHALPANRLKTWWKRQSEAFLLEPLGEIVERLAEQIQRRFIVRHTTPEQGGRVVVSSHELAFHPHSKVAGLLHQFNQDVGQKTLL